ncbi:MAG: tetratricopeptide repeat protein [Pseudomonadota bacterium]
MPTRLVQFPTQPQGTGTLQISGPALARFPAPEVIELAIIQSGGVERYLDPRNPPEPWTTAVYRFRPVMPRIEGSVLAFDIDHGVTYHLRANQPYKLLLRNTITNEEVEERFTGPVSMRRPSQMPLDWTPPPDPSGPVVAPPPAPYPLPPAPPPLAPEPEPEPMVEEAVSPAAEPAPEDESAGHKQGGSGNKKGVWLGLAALVVAAVVFGVWWMQKPPQDPAVAKETPTAPVADESLKSVRDFLSEGPESAAAAAKANALAKDGKLLDGQFLLYKYAGEKGDNAAAVAMGAFYDPDRWDKAKSPMPAPNPLEAARWYKRAAEAGDPEAQYRYATMLKKGRTDEPNAEDQAISWLQKAAQGGHEAARKDLGK